MDVDPTNAVVHRLFGASHGRRLLAAGDRKLGRQTIAVNMEINLFKLNLEFSPSGVFNFFLSLACHKYF